MRINAERLWEKLMQIAQIGGTPKGGVCRVTLTEEDRLGRDLFIKWCKEAHLSIEIDQMGNIFAKRAGKNPDLPAVLAGSHLDSQPTGGKFDGVYGVLAALEVIETLNENHIQTQHPIEIVSWTNEEGARFAPAMIGSGVFANQFSLEYAYARTDRTGETLGNALEKIGYKGTIPCGNRSYKAAFELHIEQGPILEAENKSVGIVTGVQGIRWYDLVLNGKETHAGPTPMSYRKDPVKAVLPILTRFYELTEIFADSKLTIGFLDAKPAIRNTVPSQLTVSVDFRHPDEQILTAIHQQATQIVESFSDKNGVTAQLLPIWYSPPVIFDEKCVQAVSEAVQKTGVSARKIGSGAGHDSVYLSKVVPTSMIFIPCKDGLSHNEAESAEKIDVANGTQVLLEAILKMAL